MKSLKLLTFLSVLALAPATGAFAQSNSTLSPNNPNCSPGVQGCTANYATTDHSDDVPKGNKASAMSPNCSPGQQGCTANQATTDHSDDVPQRPATNPPAH
jgi:hypothetical protein